MDSKEGRGGSKRGVKEGEREMVDTNKKQSIDDIACPVRHDALP